MNTFSLKDLRFDNPAEVTQDIKDRFAEFIGVTLFSSKDGRKQRMLSYLGYLNNVLYVCACDRGVLTKIGKTENKYRHHIDKSAIPNLLERFSANISLLGSRAYIKEWWGKRLFASLPTIKKMRSFFADELGLFAFETPEFKLQVKGEQKTAESSGYNDFDFIKSLVAYETIEHLLVSEFGWDALPEHKGAMMKRLYDLVFKSGLGMRRSPNPDAGTGDEATEQESAIERQCMAKNSKDRDRHELESLSDSLQQLVNQGVDLVESKFHDTWVNACDRIAYLEDKLFGVNWVPIDADIPF